MEQAILEDRNYEPKKEDFIDKIPETIPEGKIFYSQEIQINKTYLNASKFVRHWLSSRLSNLRLCLKPYYVNRINIEFYLNTKIINVRKCGLQLLIIIREFDLYKTELFASLFQRMNL